jgi:hypothetical protein
VDDKIAYQILQGLYLGNHLIKLSEPLWDNFIQTKED